MEAAFLTRKDVVGHSDQGVFLAEHLAVLVDKGQTVHVRIDDDAHVGPLVSYRTADLSQIFFQRFGVVGEMSVGRAVEFRNVGNPQGPQQFGNGDPAGGVDRIDHDFESCLGDRPAVYGREGQYFLDVPVDAFQVGRDGAQTVYLGIRIVIGLCRAEDFGALFRIEKFSLTVEQFQGVPLLGVVAGGEDDASVGLVVDHHHFHGRGGGQPQVDHVDAHPGEGGGN